MRWPEKLRRQEAGAELGFAMKKLSYSVLALLVFLIFPLAVYAQSGTDAGSFTFAFSDYTVQGRLVNAIINPDNTVSVTMIINDNVRTSIGRVPINASGEWSGTVNGTSVSGTIQDVWGTMKVCFFLCGQVTYTGQGTWIGMFSGSQGTGTFQGTITFVRSSISRLPGGYTLNQPYPISGNWTASFQQNAFCDC